MIAKPVQLFLKLLVVSYVSLLLLGCGGSKINQENYNKIQNEMTVAEVEAILGKSTSSNTNSISLPVLGPVSGKEAVWKDEKGTTTITITFVNDKVKFKTYKGD